MSDKNGTNEQGTYRAKVRQIFDACGCGINNNDGMVTFPLEAAFQISLEALDLMEPNIHDVAEVVDAKLDQLTVDIAKEVERTREKVKQIAGPRIVGLEHIRD